MSTPSGSLREKTTWLACSTRQRPGRMRSQGHAYFHEVAASAAAQVEAWHALWLRWRVAAPSANVGKNSFERRILGNTARIAVVDCCSQSIELRTACKVRSQAFARELVQGA